jgi:hypothetical protein
MVSSLAGKSDQFFTKLFTGMLARLAEYPVCGFGTVFL